MDILWEELSFGIPDSSQLQRIIIRLIAATVLGALIGYQREKAGKPAGLRTHILVTLGTTVLLWRVLLGMSSDGLSRVIQEYYGIGLCAGRFELDREANIIGLRRCRRLVTLPSRHHRIGPYRLQYSDVLLDSCRAYRCRIRLLSDEGKTKTAD